MSGPEDSPEEITDTQLDALLDTAAADLLRQLKATSDTGTLLSAFLEADQTAPSTPSTAITSPAIADGQTLITIRALDRALNRARSRARVLAHGRSNDLVRGLDLARELDFVGDLARELDLARNLALVRARALVRDFERENDRWPSDDLPLVRALDLALDRDYDLARDLARDRLGDDGTYTPFDQRDILRELALALDVALVLDGALALALAHPEWPWAELRELAKGQVDASGSDLTQVDVSDITLLNNVIWSDDTLWPAGTKPRIRAQSRELRPGVYLVQGGTERKNANTLR
ncbi:hypothetical protein [Streptomyces sp. NPDC005046]